jgi:hypothetical protein
MRSVPSIFLWKLFWWTVLAFGDSDDDDDLCVFFPSTIVNGENIPMGNIEGSYYSITHMNIEAENSVSF